MTVFCMHNVCSSTEFPLEDGASADIKEILKSKDIRVAVAGVPYTQCHISNCQMCRVIQERKKDKIDFESVS